MTLTHPRAMLFGVQRFTVILLASLLGILATGSLHWLHNLSHLREDAADEISTSDAKHHRHSHDETNCHLHAQLFSPIATTPWTPNNLYVGILLAIVILILQSLFSQPKDSHIDCRGPPAFLVVAVA